MAMKYAGDGITFPDSTTQKRAATMLATRQTVASAAIDANGYANFLTVGSGLAAGLSATTKAVLVAFAAGFDLNGSVDYMGQFAADASFPASMANTTAFLYADRNTSTGVLSLGSHYIPPQYRNDGGKNPVALLHCDAVGPVVDEYGGTWTNTNVTLDTTNKVFGAGSLAFNGTTSKISSSNVGDLGNLSQWTIEGRFRSGTLPGTGVVQAIASADTNTTAYCCFGLYNNAGVTKILLSLTSTGASNDIASSVVGTKTAWSAGTWYKFALVFDGSSYKLYIDGVLDITVASSTKVYWPDLKLGAFAPNASWLNGNIDEFRVSAFARYTTAFTPEVAPFSPDETWDVFSPAEMIMRKKGFGAATIQRVYLGEATVGASSISSVISYALNGQYDSGPTFTWAISSKFSSNHNTGLAKLQVQIYAQCIASDLGYAVGDLIVGPTTVPAASQIYVPHMDITRNVLSHSTGANTAMYLIPAAGGVAAAANAASWRVGMKTKRDW